MEIVVDFAVEDYVNKKKLNCDCQQCTDDIKAIMLNNLKPMYVVTDKGILYNKVKALNTQFKADILGELTKAIKIVEENPQH